MNQYRVEVDRASGVVISCVQAYDVGDDGLMVSRDGTRLIFRYHTETAAEARALAAYDVYSLRKKGEL